MATDHQLICNMAIDNVVEKISVQFHQYPLFGEKFKAICVEEAFDEISVLIDDVAEGFDESVILESLCEEIEIEKQHKEPLCAAIHYILSTFYPPPTSLNLVEIETKVTEKELTLMNHIVMEQATMLKPASYKDNALISLFVVAENNHFPLYTYLIDTCLRYQLFNAQKLYKEYSQIDDHKTRNKFAAKKFRNIYLPNFFRECHAMKKIKEKSKDDVESERILLYYEAAINSFFGRIWGPIQIHPQRVFNKINDSLYIFAKYYIGILCAVNNILQNPNTKLPQQIDFWIIPKSMTLINQFEENDDSFDDDDYDDDDDELLDDETKENVTNLNERLKYTDNLCIKYIPYNLSMSKLSHIFYQIHEDVGKGKGSKRMIMIIDRRIDGKNVIENDKNYSKLNENEIDAQDTLYAFLPKNSQNIPKGHYLHESMWSLTREEVLPSINGNYESSLNMFLLSIHVHNENVVRSYWYNDYHSFTRFFVNDMVNIWPLYFVEKNLKRDIDKAPKYQSIVEVIDLINNHLNELPLKDNNFDTFFEENTKIKPSMAYSATFKWKILISGYIRHIFKNEEKLFPIEMINLCYIYYAHPFI